MSRQYNTKLFSIRLRQLMQENDDSTYSLSKFLNMSASTISKYATGVSSPNLAVLEKISTKYDVNPEWLKGCETADKWLFKEPIPTKRIPILRTITIGKPLCEQKDILGYEYVTQNSSVDYCLKVKDNSLLNKHILNGDIVYIHEQNDIESGDIAALLFNNEVIFNRIYMLTEGLMLHSESPLYKDILLSNKDSKKVTVLGKCIGAKISFNND